MSNPNCWLRDINVQKQLEKFFSDADQQFSTYYEANPHTGEPQLDGRLASCLEKDTLDSLQLYLKHIEQKRRKAGLRPLRLSFKVTHITSAEAQHGADIGLVASLDVPGEYILTKAVLVQTKRLHPNPDDTFSENCSYPELFKQRSIPQWERMLEQTPGSVYFFYNPYQLLVRRTIKTVGTRVVSAQHISGIAHRNVRNGFTVLDAYDRGKPLAKWFVEDFICCLVGDARPEIVDTALGKNPRYPVRLSILVTVETEVTELSLWEQKGHKL